MVHDEERQRKSLANAEYFDFDVDAEHRVAVIRVLSGSSTIGNSSLYKTNNSIVNILRRISRDSSIKVLFVNKCDSIVLVFESPCGKMKNTAGCCRRSSIPHFPL